MKNTILILFLCLTSFQLFAQSAVNSSGTYQENDQGQHQFAVGDILLNAQSEAGYILGGIQQVILNANDIEFSIDTTTVGLFNPDEEELLINVYPNPTENKLFLSHKHLSNLNFLLLDNSGKVLQQRVITSNSAFVDLSSYNNGIYYLQLTDRISKKTVTISIAKQ